MYLTRLYPQLTHFIFPHRNIVGIYYKSLLGLDTKCHDDRFTRLTIAHGIFCIDLCLFWIPCQVKPSTHRTRVSLAKFFKIKDIEFNIRTMIQNDIRKIR
ncbi:hypothetical protein [Salmonella phage SPHG3]|uniref:Uncharacterized protein n=1 Tax=Salmonella phage SPHG3 TaxID=2801526 RepID=A0A7T7Z876_9CAUD|nr:hypothetical protein [Salmonella phage SPHG3]